MDAQTGRSTSRHEGKIREYWDWAAVALFLLVTVDLLTTLYASEVVGLEAETNPIMIWLLRQPTVVMIGVHIGVVIAAVLLFHLLMRLFWLTPEPYSVYFGLLIELWLGGLVAAGLFIFANNLSVIVLGKSLL